ncbi:MAG TPA: hypothetical protein VFE96_05075 [Candidatus Bathyarchaeia archaeon]|nr:hypothetical protein [Candidatus Bathyarchaeia archaeon]
MNSRDLEAQATPRIKDALKAAIQFVGEEEFARISGIEVSALVRTLASNEDYLPVAVVTLACQVNKNNGDINPARSSISECLKGAILRLPSERSPSILKHDEASDRRRRRSEFFKSEKGRSGTYDASALRVLGYTANIFVFFVLGYFLGGIALGPLIGFPPCVGITGMSPWLTPCTGSILGLILAAILWLGYTYYYFVKKL